MTKRYSLEGMHCAGCAARIEEGLQKYKGLEKSRVNFLTSVVVLDKQYEEEARRIIQEVEPDIRMIAQEEVSSAPFPWSLIRLLLSGGIFAGGVIFAGRLEGWLGGWGLRGVFFSAYLIAGVPVLWGALRHLLKGRVFDELFLMSIASLGAAIIGELPEAAGVMLFYGVGEELQNRAVARSRGAVRELMDLRPDRARVVTGEGSTQIVNPAVVEVGTLIEIRPGEGVPLDGVVESGESSLITSALTGEAFPRQVEAGSPVSAGFVNEGGRLRVRTTKVFGESTAAKVLELVENAAALKSPTEKFITKFARVYTPAVVGAAALTAFLPPLFLGEPLEAWVYRALVLLVISCPCALVISIPLGYLGGMGAASRQKILVKGAHFIDALKNVDTVVYDKTGTLTEGDFRVQEVLPAPGFSSQELLRLAAHAESLSTHPLAGSLGRAWGGEMDEKGVEDFLEEKGLGVTAAVEGKRILVGGRRLLEREGISLPSAPAGGTMVYTAVDGAFAGMIYLDDKIKPGAAAVADSLRSLGVKRQWMLTGDHRVPAEKIARALDLDGFYAGLLPGEKAERLEEIMNQGKGGVTLFAGDGINDAPVIMRADVGAAMGGLGSDAAIEAADVVLMDDDVRRIPQALKIARYTRKIVWQNIAFALGAKLIFLSFGVFGSLSMGWAVVADVGVALLAVLNAVRGLSYAPPLETP